MLKQKAGKKERRNFGNKWSGQLHSPFSSPPAECSELRIGWAPDSGEEETISGSDGISDTCFTRLSVRRFTDSSSCTVGDEKQKEKSAIKAILLVSSRSHRLLECVVGCIYAPHKRHQWKALANVLNLRLLRDFRPVTNTNLRIHNILSYLFRPYSVIFG
jgi:hypothetical protein